MVGHVRPTGEIAPERGIRVAKINGYNASPVSLHAIGPRACPRGDDIEVSSIFGPCKSRVIVQRMVGELYTRRVRKAVERVRGPRPDLSTRLQVPAERRAAVGRAVLVIVITQLHLQSRRLYVFV